MPELSSDERDALADALKRLTTRYDNLVRDQLSVHDGLSPDADGRQDASGVAFSCALLSAAAAVGDGAEIYGGL